MCGEDEGRNANAGTRGRSGFRWLRTNVRGGRTTDAGVDTNETAFEASLIVGVVVDSGDDALW